MKLNLNKIAKTIRVVTIAPVMALLLLIALYTARPEFFGGRLNLALAAVFLTALPVSAYPLQPFVPRYKNAGREGQRNLAIVMAGVGYCLGVLTALFTRAPKELWIVYLTYLLSGLLIALFNKALKVRASGHACGVAGPAFSSIFFMGPSALWSLAALAAVYWASLRMGRHRLSELLVGTAIPCFAMLVSYLAVKLF